MSTENSRADALTKQQRKSLEWLDRLCTPSMYLSRLGPIRDYIKEVLAASPSSQPAAARIALDQGAHTPGWKCPACGRGKGFNHNGCRLAFSPSPADERAAFEAWRDEHAFNMQRGGLTEEYAWGAWQARAASASETGRIMLAEDRIDWIANAHCPNGTAYPANVKNAIREALREAQRGDTP